jgi:hypothetical protein
MLVMAAVKTDKRLLGTWRSDRRRTMQDWVWPQGTRNERRNRFSEVFGRLTIRYTRQKIHFDLNGRKDSQAYEVLGSDANSVAILHNQGGAEGGIILHIQFEWKDLYWVPLGHNREYFKRVKTA